LKAKYLAKAFIQKLPDKGTDQAGSAKHWSVYRRKRRSWKEKTPTPEKDPTDVAAANGGKDVMGVEQGR
jgi:hypothetical protein